MRRVLLLILSSVGCHTANVPVREPASEIARSGGRVEVSADGNILLSPATDRAIVFTGLDPANRVPRNASSFLSWPAPGQSANQTAEFRIITGTFDNNRDPTTRNSVMHAGWNYTSGFAQIDPNFGSIGDSWENAWGPPQVTGDTWSERHWHFTPPGGSIRRPFSMYGSWATGETGLTIAATRGSLQFVSADMTEKTELLNWNNGVSMSVGGLGFWYGANGEVRNRQINGDGTYFIGLPFADGNEVVIGSDPGHPPFGAIAQVRVRAVRYVGTDAANVLTPPAGSATVFFDSATGTFGVKKSDGTVKHLVEN